jgi:vitamin B12 transporter
MPERRTIDSTLLVLGTLAAAAAVQAQDDETDRIVVVGSRLADDGFGAGNVVVRDSDVIERSVPGDSEQLLRSLPGVSLFRPGGAGGVSEVFVRGGESNFTAVYVDGVRLNDTTNTRGGSFDFSTLPAFRIGRLELAPGAMSAIYGSDTMAGVIRIESAWPERGELLARAEVGSESDWRADVGSTFPLADDSELSLIGSAGDAGDEIEGSALESRSVSARLRIGEDGGWTLVARLAERDRTSFPEVSGGPLLSVLREHETSETEQMSFSAATGWSLSDAWTAELTISHAETEDDYRSPPIAPGVLDGQPAFTTVTDFSRTEVLFVNRIQINPELHLAFGLDHVIEDGSDDGSIDFGFVMPAAYELDRDISSLFAEVGRHLGAGIDASVALRADRAGGDTEVSGKLDVAKRFDAGDARLWLSAANGFKLPSFFALGNPLYGNPGLRPEQVESLELGFDHEASDRIAYGVSLFRNEYEDLVDFDFETFTSINRASVDIDGVQARITYAASGSTRISFSATDLSIETGEGESALPRRPEELVTVAVDRALDGGWSVTGRVRHVGKRTISSIPTGVIEDGSYEVVDVAVRKTSDDGLSWWVALDNLLDEDYRHAPGFPAPGAHVRLGAQLSY